MTTAAKTATAEAPAKRKGRPKKESPSVEAAAGLQRGNVVQVYRTNQRESFTGGIVSVHDQTPPEITVLAPDGARIRMLLSDCFPASHLQFALLRKGDRVKFPAPRDPKGEWTVKLDQQPGQKALLMQVGQPDVQVARTEIQVVFRTQLEDLEADILKTAPAHAAPEQAEVSAAPEAAEQPMTPSTAGQGTQLVPWNLVHPSDLNPRKKFDGEALRELALDIQAKGVLQNLVVRPHPTRAGEYEIAAGERRWRAVQMVATGQLLEEGEPLSADPDLPVPVLIRQMSDRELLEVATAENVQRRRMTPMEEAEAFAAIAAQGASPAEIAHKFGYAERTVVRRIQIAQNLTPAGKEAFDNGKLTLGQAEIIALAPASMQVGLINNASWRKPEDLKQTITAGAFLVRHRRFDPALYTGQVVEDLFGDIEPYYHDSKQALALQVAHVEAEAARDLEAGVAFSKVIAHGGSYYNLNYEYPQRDGATGVVHLIDTRTGEVTTANQRTTREAAGLRVPSPEQAQYGWHANHTAGKIRSGVLENALFGAPKLALALWIAEALLDDSGIQFLNPSPEVLDFCAQVTDLTDEVLVMGDEAALEVGPKPADEAEEEQESYSEDVVLRALMDLPEEVFNRLLTLRAAAGVDLSGYHSERGSWVAQELKVSLKGQVELTPELLKDVNYLGLMEIATQAGWTPDDLATDEAGLRKQLLKKAQTLRAEGFVPAFMDFKATAD